MGLRPGPGAVVPAFVARLCEGMDACVGVVLGWVGLPQDDPTRPLPLSLSLPRPLQVFMPALSSTMTEGKIVSWLKQVGDKVKKGEPIVVVESDKADMDVESFAEGILGAIVVAEGERANVGSPIAFVAESAGEVDEAKKKAAAFGGAAPAAAAAPAPAPAAAPAPVRPHQLRMLACRTRTLCARVLRAIA